MTQPIAPATAALDQALVTAGYELVAAHREKPRDPDRIDAARAKLEAARAARWPNA